MDALLFLRGSQNLCLDLIENPEHVRSTLREIMRGYKWQFETRFARIPIEHGWSSGGMWAPGRFAELCCDFSAMIGPRWFREFVLPDLEEIARSVDYCYYHLDGPGALQHLPTLLEIEALDGIQWVRGAAEREWGSALKWIPLCKRIQAAGKVVQLDARYDEVEPLLQELDPKRLMILTQAPTIEAAEELLRNAERINGKTRTYLVQGLGENTNSS
jgi:hypothetical protein